MSALLLDLLAERDDAVHFVSDPSIDEVDRQMWSNLGAICDHAIGLLRKAGAREDLVPDVEITEYSVTPK